MKRIFVKICAVIMAAAVLMSLTACESGSKDPMDAIPNSSAGRDITRAKAADDVFSLNINRKYSLNPLIATDHSNQLICSLVYENMLELGNDFNVIEGAGIINDYTVSEDGRLWTFYIDEGHVFHDGSPVTGGDLRYSLDRAISSDRFQGRFSSIQGTSHADDKLIVALGIPDTQFYKLLNIPVIKSGSFNDNPPMGSGPYAINEECTELTAYEGYKSYRTLPVEKVYLKEYPEADTKIIAYEDSLIDVVINDPSSYSSLGFASTNEVHKYATTNMHFVAFNEERPLAQMNTFRVAMQYAFDRDYFVELLQGNAVASAIPMYPTCDIYPDQLNNELRYNPDRCKNILESVGIKDYDEDGMLELMEGSSEDITLHFLVCSGSSAKGGVVNRFAQDMEKIGIKVIVHELPWNDYITALQEGKLEKDDYDMFYGEVRLRNNFDLTELLQVRDEDNELTNMNFTKSKDDSFLTYINSYLAAPDMGRDEAYQALCEYISRSTGAFITIGFEMNQIITHRGVIKGINANAGNPLFGFENWEIDLS